MPTGRHATFVVPAGRDVIVRSRNRGLTEILTNPALARRRVNDSRDRITPQVEGLGARAKEQGTLRPDVEGTDAIFIQPALAIVMDSSRDVAPELYRRYLAIFLGGLRADRGPLTPLPVGRPDSRLTAAGPGGPGHDAVSETGSSAALPTLELPYAARDRPLVRRRTGVRLPRA